MPRFVSFTAPTHLANTNNWIVRNWQSMKGTVKWQFSRTAFWTGSTHLWEADGRSHAGEACSASVSLNRGVPVVWQSCTDWERRIKLLRQSSYRAWLKQAWNLGQVLLRGGPGNNWLLQVWWRPARSADMLDKIWAGVWLYCFLKLLGNAQLPLPADSTAKYSHRVILNTDHKTFTTARGKEISIRHSIFHSNYFWTNSLVLFLDHIWAHVTLVLKCVLVQYLSGNEIIALIFVLFIEM